MNASLRSSLILEPRPSDASWCGVTLDGDGWRVSWLREGRVEQPFGPVFVSAGQAAEAARYIRASHGLGQ